MVTIKENYNFPTISSNAWWAVRKKFYQTLPKTVTDTYLAGFLEMEPNSAKSNVLLPLKKLGLIDNEGKPTERAKRWRDDAQYPEVCEEIRTEIYPQELLDTFPDLTSPRANVEKWFANRASVGERASQKMAALYLLLTEANPNASDNNPSMAKAPKPKKTTFPPSNNATGKKGTTEKSNGNAHVPLSSTQPEIVPNIQPPPQYGNGIVPSLHIDIQIHIAPDASAEQIDQIFASMNRHLYKGNNVNE